MITVMHTAKYMASSPHRIGDRFVRTLLPGKSYAWCIRDAVDHRYDVQQGLCDREDLPDDVRKAADARFGHFPSYVEWKL